VWGTAGYLVDHTDPYPPEPLLSLERDVPRGPAVAMLVFLQLSQLKGTIQHQVRHCVLYIRILLDIRSDETINFRKTLVSKLYNLCK